MASRNSGPGGMKILWIPGKKKHNRKGVYSSTNKEVKQAVHTRQQQSWAMGGIQNQNKLMNM